MMVLIPKTNINFIGKRFIAFAISGAAVLITAISLATKGINFGLDFRGGTLIQVKFEGKKEIKDIRTALDGAGLPAEIQSYTGRNAFAVRVKGRQENVNDVADKIKTALNKSFPSDKYEIERAEFVGPAVGRDLTKKALWAMILSFLGIIIYVAFRFNNPLWGAMGVMALFHDVFITLGALSISGREVDLVIVAALLTIAGYSINDTIVIFDRMRENLRLHPRMPFGELINLSMNETLSRTIITNFTVLSAVLVLFIWGGDVINNFAFTMLVGSICGSYSTIAVVTPALYQWANKDKK